MYSSSSDICIPCPNEAWCPNGVSCAEGHVGAGCASCANGYFFLNDTCQTCPSNSSLIYLVMGGVLLVFCFVIYKISGKHINPAIFAVSNMSINHFQIISLSVNLKFDLPNVFVEMINWIQAVFGFMFVDLLASPECQVKMDFYDKWALLAFFPLMLTAFFLILLFIPSTSDFNRKIFHMIELVNSVMYIFAISQAFKLWDCVPLEDGTYVLEWDPDIQCFEGDAWTGMATIALCLFSVYIFFPPLFFFWLLAKERHLPNSTEVIDVDWIKDRYKPDFIYWEPMVVMPKKFFLLFWATFMPDQHSQAALTLITLMIFWSIHAYNRPYNNVHKSSPELENNLKNWLYSFEVALLVGMWIYSSIGGNGTIATLIFMFIYGVALIWILWNIKKLKDRLDELYEEDADRENLAKKQDGLELGETIFS